MGLDFCAQLLIKRMDRKSDCAMCFDFDSISACEPATIAKLHTWPSSIPFSMFPTGFGKASLLCCQITRRLNRDPRFTAILMRLRQFAAGVDLCLGSPARHNLLRDNSHHAAVPLVQIRYRMARTLPRERASCALKYIRHAGVRLRSINFTHIRFPCKFQESGRRLLQDARTILARHFRVQSTP